MNRELLTDIDQTMDIEAMLQYYALPIGVRQVINRAALCIAPVCGVSRTVALIVDD